MLLGFLAIFVGCGLDPLVKDKDVTGDDTGDADPVESGSLTVSPGSLAFGDVATGEQATRDLTLENTGDRTIILLDPTITGDTVFWTESVTGFPTDLAVSSTMVVTVGFAPEHAAAYSASAEFSVNGEDTSASIALAGTGTGTGGSTDDTADTGDPTTHGLTLSTSSIDFGGVYTNVSSSVDLTVTNGSSGQILIEDLIASDAAFTAGGEIDTPQVMNAGASKTLTITFSPSDIAPYSAVVTVVTDKDPDDEYPIAVTGEGLEPLCTICDPNIAVETGGSDEHSMQFASVLGFADEQILTIRNESDVDLDITGYDFTNDSQGGTFTITGLGAVTLPAWTTTAATISYTCATFCIDLPVSWTDENILHIYSSDPSESDYTVELSGI